jgi:MFS transporter, UMF1 family
MEEAIIKNDKKTIRAWAFFDWANSVYALVISTAIFPIYFTSVSDEVVKLFGTEINNGSLYTFTVTISYIIIAALSPLLSGIADSAGRRLFFLRFFTTIGAISCMSMYFFIESTDVWIGLTSFAFATIGFAGSLVFYDSYLPIIVSEDQYDRISARGYTYGYIGSMIVLLFILFMNEKPEVFGMEKGTLPSRIGFVLVGVWWLGFAQYTFQRMPKDLKTPIDYSSFNRGYKEVKKVFDEALSFVNLKKFLFSFFFFMAGVQTVVYVATVFADKELKMSTAEMILTILLIQILGIIGAILFSRVSEKYGNRPALLVQIVVWFFVCIAAYLCTNKYQFYGIAAAVGMVMGGIQALARASYSKLIPTTTQDYTSYFSLYDVVYKVAIVVGTFLFGFVNQLTNSMRYSALTLALLFLLGFIFLWTVRFPGQGEEKLN